MKKIIFISLGFFLSVQNFAQVNWLTFEKENCKVDYPSGWYEETMSEDLSQAGVKFMLMSPIEGKKDKFSENMNLAYEQKKAPITLQQFISATSSTLSHIIEKFKIKSSTTKTNASGEYVCMEYTGNMSEYKLQWMQCVWIKGVDIYVLSFAAAQSSYKKFKPLFVRMADSFRIGVK